MLLPANKKQENIKMKRMLDKLQTQKARISTLSEDETSITLRFAYSPKSFPILLTIKNCLILQLIGSIHESADLTNNLLSNEIGAPTSVVIYGYRISYDSEDFIDITFTYSNTTGKNTLKGLLNNPVDVLTYSLDIGCIEV